MLLQISHLSGLAALKSLTITDVQPAEFSHCCRLGCYVRLTNLTQLTSLKVLAPRAGATAAGGGANGVAAANGNMAANGGLLPAGALDPDEEGASREPHLHFLSAMTALGECIVHA